MVYRNEAELLRKNGIEVVAYEKKNDDIASRFSASISTVWAEQTYRELVTLIKKEKPDIAHFHNIWYLISPSAYYACKDAGVPVVQTLHNFRMFCANGLLLREGKVCEDCIGRIPWRGVTRGCYRNSWQYSLPVALSEMYHKQKKTWTEQVDAYIALTEFGKNKFIECGLPEKKIFIKPNFISGSPDSTTSSQNYAVFIGRLSKEKGIDVLIDALKNFKTSELQSSESFSFKIIGDGPLREQAEAKSIGQGAKGVKIEFTGRRSHKECMELLKNARFLVMPALCYENFPLTIVEAFACGKPVVASRLGVMADIVEDNKTGMLFEPGNAEDLANAIKRLWEDEALCREIGQNARAEFEKKYTAEKNIKSLIDIYHETIKRQRTCE